MESTKKKSILHSVKYFALYFEPSGFYQQLSSQFLILCNYLLISQPCLQTHLGSETLKSCRQQPSTPHLLYVLEQRLGRVSQVLPLNPSGQLQVKSFTASVHSPPYKHGLDAQSSEKYTGTIAYQFTKKNMYKSLH